ncbi:helix-turn-helix domain-containing protein [Paenibacillus oceani]|uniref:Helix-turn-helix domain-containing protein n=1 Tax=Paenibacillus oceani TaxID=2772510 RepID=A0A927GZI7_9BACL|nr:helix-turn-helix domain-containing protein [Paenibacillus oceani]MBD2862685.1 helix-turn-helix domain-containing protein [Paenibacillus oceani]
MNRSKQDQSLFFKFMIPYMIVLLIPLLIGLITYRGTVEMIEKEVVNNNMTLLRQSKETLDRRLAEVETVSNQMATDTRVMQFQTIREPFEGANTYRVMETRKGLYDYGLSNHFISGSYLLFKRSGLALSSKLTYTLPDFFNHVLTYPDMDYSAWYSLLLDRHYNKTYLPARQVVLSGEARSMVTYVQSLGYPGFEQGAVVTLIRNEEIVKLLRGLDVSDGGWAYVADDKGQMISYVASRKDQTPERIETLAEEGAYLDPASGMMVTYTTSEANKWTYVVVQSPQVVLGKVHYIKKLTIAIVFAALALGCLIAGLLAYRNSRPLRSLMRTVHERLPAESPRTRDAYRLLHHSFSALLDRNKELHSTLVEQAPLLRASFFERLFKGEFGNESDTDTGFRHLGLRLEGGLYAVGLVRLGGEPTERTTDLLHELSASRLRIKDVFAQLADGTGYAHDMEDDKLALLFIGMHDDEERFRDEIDRRLSSLRRNLKLGVRIVFAVGGIYRTLPEAAHSYEEARQALYIHKWDSRADVIWSGDCPNTALGYYYPADTETRLFHLVRAGEDEEMRKLFDWLYRENFVERQLSIPMLRLLVHDVSGSIVKLLDQVQVAEEEVGFSVKSIVDHTDSPEKAERYFIALSDVLQTICDRINERKKSHNARLSDTIVAMIHAEYGNADFSLTAVAEQVNHSEAYLSQFFKGQIGINFFEYLETVRMEEAHRLLSDSGGLAVREIAARVGYSSSNTFCRAFKRFHGVSTTVYRQAGRCNEYGKA